MSQMSARFEAFDVSDKVSFTGLIFIAVMVVLFIYLEGESLSKPEGFFSLVVIVIVILIFGITVLNVLRRQARDIKIHELEEQATVYRKIAIEFNTPESRLQMLWEIADVYKFHKRMACHVHGALIETPNDQTLLLNREQHEEAARRQKEMFEVYYHYVGKMDEGLPRQSEFLTEINNQR